MNKLFKILALAGSLGVASSGYGALTGNAASPLQGFDLGGGQYATLIGLQDIGTSLDGATISYTDINAAVTSGSILGFFYGPGNAVSSSFDNISLYAPFTSDTVSAGSDPARADRIWDSLYIVHEGNVVFDGTNTVGTGGSREQRNPFEQVPDAGATAALLGIGLLGLAAARRKLS